MKRVTAIFAFLFVSTLFGQVTNEGIPLSWELALPDVPAVVMNTVDLYRLQEEDRVNDQKTHIPWRFGEELAVDLGLDTSGAWYELQNGDRIWRLKINSPDAKTMNFIFNDYFLPPGATLYLYNDDKTDVLGAYTGDLNREDKQLGTWFIEGDIIWLEYYEPASQRGLGSLNLSKVVHGYRTITEKEITPKDLNDSGACNYDVNCSVGTDYDSIKDVLKRSVGLVLFGGSVCTGTLITNTEYNNAPYFLTANHCDNGNPGVWAFRFNWISPSPSCGSNSNSGNGNSNLTTSGATKLAANSKTDFMLVNIDGNLPSSWNLTWAGWNRSSTEIPNFTVGIHHPQGDIMKICRSNLPPLKTTINFSPNPSASVWRVLSWNLGVTEVGSSGSALFDENGRIIGQLAGGTSGCTGTNNNGGSDYYGRFDVSWDYGTTNNTRLSNWLDPNNTGVMATNLLTVPDFQYMGSISIFPNPASSEIYVANNNSSQLTYQIFSVTGQLVGGDKLPFLNNAIPVDSLSEGVYFLKLHDMASDSSLVRRIIIKK